ncbi:fimbria/pilus outer membrane usher protein [Enterobacter cloacae]|uniref:fimbria/pilus outer membrane usher protein n=1 Tax=Enterobacter cloacae TaxID=550 RepID=UPI00345CB77B
MDSLFRRGGGVKKSISPGVMVLMILFFSHKTFGEQGFDLQTLNQLGFGNEVAEFFDKVRFLPGHHEIIIEVNVAERYRETVLFDDKGELCLDKALLESLNLKAENVPEECGTLSDVWPEALIEYFPGDFRVALTLPERAFDAEKIRGEFRGGFASLLSYDLYSSRLRTHNDSQRSLQAMLTPGINIKNWVIRNRSNYSQNGKVKQFTVLETSVQRELAGGKARLQLGEFGMVGSLNTGLPVTGMQISSGQDVISGASLSVPLEGIAQTQSTVEVRQRGQVVYRTMLPPGPFTLKHLGSAVGGIETEVEVVGADGQKQSFMVTPTTGDESSREKGYQIGVGRYRNYVNAGAGVPLLLTGEKHWRLSNQQSLGLGSVLAARYQNVSGRWGRMTEKGHWLSVGSNLSRGQRSGGMVNVQGKLALGKSITLSAFSQYYTRGYRDADQALSDQKNREDYTIRMNNSLSLSWGTPLWGAFSYNISSSNPYRGRRSLTHFASYSTRLGKSSFNLSFRRSGKERAAVYASMSFPLGGGNTGTRIQSTRDNGVLVGSSWQGGDASLNGRLDVNRNGEGEYGFGGAVSGNTAYSRLGVSGVRSASTSSTLALTASGSLGVVNGTWVTSPNPAGDSMAVVTIPGVSGINIYGGGAGTTDFAGSALLPSIPAHQPVSVMVDTQALPLNLRLDSTSADLKLAYGSVATRQFVPTEVRQLLLTVHDGEGKALPLGASVHDEEGAFKGTLVGEGNLLLINDDIGKPFRIRRANRAECWLHYDIPDSFDPGALYEESEALCLNERPG